MNASLPQYVNEVHARNSNCWGHWDIFGPDEKEIEPNRIEDACIDVFTRGHCHSFALAVRHLTGGQVTMFAINPTYFSPLETDWFDDAYPNVELDDEEMTSPDHFVCRVPDGRCFDIRGWQDVSDGEPWEPLRTAREWHECGYKTPRVRDALPFAESILKELSLKRYII